MTTYRLTDERFGDTTTTYSGPIDALVLGMRQTIRSWAAEQRRDGETLDHAADRIEREFVAGLETVADTNGIRVGPGW